MAYVFTAAGDEYETATAAIARIEMMGSGSVVKFAVEPNLPFCLPEMVYRSIALWVYEGGKWQQRSIFDGVSIGLGESRPS